MRKCIGKTSSLIHLMVNGENQYQVRSTNDVKSFQFRQIFDVAFRIWLGNWSSVQAVVYKTHFPYVVCTINGGILYKVDNVS